MINVFGKEECVQGTHQGFLARSIPARRRHGLQCRPHSTKKERPPDGAVSQEKQLPLDMIDGLSDEQKELLALSKKMSDDELKRFIAAMKAMLGESM